MMSEEESEEVIATIDEMLAGYYLEYGAEMMAYVLEELATYYRWCANETDVDEYVEEEFEKITKKYKENDDD